VPEGILIDVVSARLRKANNRDYCDLALLLAGFLRGPKRDREALELLDQVTERCLDNVRAPLNKAVRLLYDLGDPEGALESIEVALERAYRTGCYRREALANKARILLKLGRGEELSRVLEEIMSLKMTKGVRDIGRERDFVDRAPAGMIPADILARYNEFRPKKPTDTDADEPPLWEPPEEAE
jgi:tetratricopeptide (TPR) repeat protein